MINTQESICQESSIWDLHIHSCKCPKSSGEFQTLSTDDFFKKLDDIFVNYPDLKMISFTDHNSISEEIYGKALTRKWSLPNLSIMIGIEVDTYLDSNSKHVKHLIYYFDPNKFDISKHAKLINEKIGGKAIVLHDFLNYLITEIKVPFLISPHFMKQDDRGIETEWIDSEGSMKNIDKYIDQLFCFWETSSAAQIEHAHNYLEMFDRKEKVSVIAFSDSSDSVKLEQYLKKPHQYFNSLASFDGLRLAGTDIRRIKHKKQFVEQADKSLYIGKVVQGADNEITFSSKLNAIIGGRGSGKSLLIDGIAYFLNPSKIDENDQLIERKKYLEDLNYQVFDLNGNLLNMHDFKFEYFNQGYVLNLFKTNKDDYISSYYLKDEFAKIEEFDTDAVKNEIKEGIAYKKGVLDSKEENLVSICEKIIKLPEDKKSITIKKGKENKAIDYLEIDKVLEALSKSSITPKELKGNSKIVQKYFELINAIQEETNAYNQKMIKDNFGHAFASAYSELAAAKSQNSKKKKDTSKLLESKLKDCITPIANRVTRINAILKYKQKYLHDSHHTEASGYKDNKFLFAKELNVQPLTKYLHSVFCSYFEKQKIRDLFGVDRDDFNNLFALIKAYCYYPEKVLLQSKSMDELEQELDSLDSLNITKSCEVYYSSGGKMISLRKVSPGTRANLIMEYIVFKDSNIPLIIDQPEDNIDNKTIYKDLTEWFNDLKKKRQVIVATHDANIVVNADSENIIVCSQTSNDVFDYKSGALEYGDNLKDVSTILDGGRDALERRLNKYGKNN